MPSNLPDMPATELFSGIYYDGQTPSGRNVSLSFLGDRLELTFNDSGQTAHWPYTDITHSGPLMSGSSAQFGNSKSENVRVFVEDEQCTHRLLLKCPHLTNRRKNRILLMLSGLVAVVSLSVISFVWFADLSPARMVAETMPNQLRDKLGDAVIRQIINNRQQCNNEQGARTFKKLTDRLIQNGGSLNNYKFHVAKLGIVNAFAAPGARIVVSDKLIEFVKSPEELAGVLAHEMGHGIAMHPETGIVRAMGYSFFLQLLLGGSAGNIGDAGLLLLQLNYTRAAEREADKLALQILNKAKIDARKVSDFFTRVIEVYEPERKPKSEDDGDLIESALFLFRTHPPTSDRAEMFAKARNWPQYPVLTDQEWAALKNICN